MNATAIVDMIIGFIAIVIGVILLPLLAGFLATAKADTNIVAITGLDAVLDIIAYCFAFALVALGVALMVVGFKKVKG